MKTLHVVSSVYQPWEFRARAYDTEFLAMSALASDTVRSAPEAALELVDSRNAPEPTQLPNMDEDDDGCIQTIDQLVRKRARTHPHHVVVSYPSSGVQYVDYSMQQLDVFAYRVARIYGAHVPPRATSDEKPQVVAILGPSNLDYLITILALTKLGHTVLFLSTRITQEAVDSLLTSTGARFLLHHRNFSAVADAARRAIPALGVGEIANGSEYNFPVDVYADTNLVASLDPATETNYPVFIIHSSGTSTVLTLSAITNVRFRINRSPQGNPPDPKVRGGKLRNAPRPEGVHHPPALPQPRHLKHVPRPARRAAHPPLQRRPAPHARTSHHHPLALRLRHLLRRAVRVEAARRDRGGRHATT